jgi:predicted SnoaL-like aldol condensation-catalyzing enzyme
MNQPKIDIQGFKKAHWTDLEVSNATAVLEFVQLIMNDHNFDEIKHRQGSSPYKQHNRTIADNIGGVIETVSNLVKTTPEFSYDVKSVFVDNDHVIIHSHATLKAKHRGDVSQGMNIIDTWKVEDGQLVEHWDAVQGISFSMRLFSLLTGGKLRNHNGPF